MICGGPCGLPTDQVSKTWEPLGWCRACWVIQRKAAWKAYKLALREGWIAIPDTCSECERSEPEVKISGHHTNYLDAYHVTWLCQSCHAKAHRRAEKVTGQTW